MRTMLAAVAVLYTSLTLAYTTGVEASPTVPSRRTTVTARVNTPVQRPVRDEVHTSVLTLPTAPNPDHPEVLVHVPPSFDPRGPVNVVVFLHGWNNCVRTLAGPVNAACRPRGAQRRGADLIARFDRARVNALLIVPQLAFDRASSDPGRFGEPSGFRAMIAEVLAAPEVTAHTNGTRSLSDLGRVILAAHSGGFVAAANVLEKGGVRVDEVLLLDALYRLEAPFERWARDRIAEGVANPDANRHGPPRFVSLYTTRGGPGRNSRALVHRVARAMPETTRQRAVHDGRDNRPPADSALRRPLVAQQTAVAHGEVPRAFLTQLLATSSLPGASAGSIGAVAPPTAVGGGPGARSGAR